jgi:hypothetical protein
MSSISSEVALRSIELAPSRWSLLVWLSGLTIALAAVAFSGLSLIWQLLAGMVLLCIGLLEWRQQRRLRSVQFSPEIICATLLTGQKLEATWPLPGMVNRYWIGLGFPAAPGRPVWLTIYADQLPADDFRHLRIMMRR